MTVPQQLHLVDDTELRDDPSLAPRCSSTVSPEARDAREKRSKRSKAMWADPDMRERIRAANMRGRRAARNAPRYSSTDEAVHGIDRRRAEIGLTHEAFCQRARISFWTWRDLRRGAFAPTRKMLVRLETALASEPPPAKPPAVIKSYHRLVMRMLAQALGRDPDAVAGVDLTVQRPQVPDWLEAARINNMAIYLTTVELEVENVAFARALGISREAVRKARARVEDLRDDPAIDALLTTITQQVRG